MVCPFPGMDPFLENQEWEDFHTTMITVIREFLTPRVGPNYVVRVERRIYLEHLLHESGQTFVSDLAVLEDPSRGAKLSSEASTSTTIAPVQCLLPMPEEKREPFLTVRERETMTVVTVLELLSPSNKRLVSDGRAQYLAKRESVLDSQAHLIELDLLRGGARLPMISELPPGDYYAIVSRREDRPRADVYAWTLRQPLPTIPVPLKSGDAEVMLDRQAAFQTVYDRARYDLSFNYEAELAPRLSEPDAAWVKQVLEAARSNP